VATGATVLTCRTAAGQEDKPALAEKPVANSAKTGGEGGLPPAWGKESGGLQAGLVLTAPASIGPTISARRSRWSSGVRNVGKEDVKFQYVPQFLMEKPPAVMDGEDKAGPPRRRHPLRVSHPGGCDLAAGEGIRPYELKLELGSGSGQGYRCTQASDHLWDGEVPYPVRAGSWELVIGVHQA